MNDITRLQLALHMPRRDWRFWAALATFCLVALAAVAFWSTLGDNADLKADNVQLRAQVATGDAVAECRSAAAVYADTAAQRASSLQSFALIALADGRPLDPYTAALEVANRNALKALDERDAAVSRCTIDPAYRIDPAGLEPVPSIPEPGGTP